MESFFPEIGSTSGKLIPLRPNSPTPKGEELEFNGPLSKDFWEKSQGLNSSYTDSFNYAVYDQLHERHKKKGIRGGVVFNTGLRLVNYHPSCTKCHYAFEIDTYGRGCTFNCSYCYAKDQLEWHGLWNRPQPFPIDIVKLRKSFFTVFETDRKSRWREILEKRIPLRIGSMSDSFMWIDHQYRVTYELLKILKFYRYPYIIFTRSDLVSHDDYMAVLDKKLASVQFSISSVNDEMTRKMEPGAPSSKRRFIALKKLSEAGFWTTIRVNPLFPTYPDGYFTDLGSIKERFGSRDAVPKFDFFNIDNTSEFLGQASEAGVPSLLAGFVRLTPTSLNRVSRAANFDLRQFFKPENLRGHKDRTYSDSEIAFYYKKLQSDCAKFGVRFNTCYIGNGEKDYFQYQKLWSNKKDCCDAKGNVAAFKETSQSISWEVREKHARSKAFVERSKAQEINSIQDIPKIRIPDRKVTNETRPEAPL